MNKLIKVYVRFHVFNKNRRICCNISWKHGSCHPFTRVDHRGLKTHVCRGRRKGRGLFYSFRYGHSSSYPTNYCHSTNTTKDGALNWFDRNRAIYIYLTLFCKNISIVIFSFYHHWYLSVNPGTKTSQEIKT